ncbi:DUF4224 domain-containing protein [Paraburkholderia phytofirmans]|uniref:DUF4224 domain-containing protein n=1 Tax=Paraburkholderia sp. BL9I2N2 TaxID=1938809 RepID=UPI00104B30C2|nr:DUF4224 domain-containing protein [Paraburkholderia sp. BL9I2N2]TCK94124.1 uncharacterized protein DUF4224 [Paraburkholderia sp. BL9I2N2]
MNERLLSPEDLIRITSARRYSKQRRWFKQQFGIDVVCNGRGEVIMLWSAFDALVLREWNLTRTSAPEPKDVELFYD